MTTFLAAHAAQLSAERRLLESNFGARAVRWWFEKSEPIVRAAAGSGLNKAAVGAISSEFWNDYSALVQNFGYAVKQNTIGKDVELSW